MNDTDHTYYYEKVRNGLWVVKHGDRVISEHSMERGAQAMLNRILTPTPLADFNG